MIGRTTPLLALFEKDRSRSRLDELCDFAPVLGEQEERVLWLVRFVEWIRPRDGERAEVKLRFLARQVEQRPEWKEKLSATFGALLADTEIDRLLAYGGISLDFHFAGAVKEWLVGRALPSACRTHDAAQILRLAFRATDLPWLARPETIAFFRTLVPRELHPELERALRDALVDLAHQILAQARAPSVRSLSQTERSPYRGLYDAVAALDATPDDATLSALRGRIQQCARMLRAHRDELAQRGADLNTTFQLGRMRQQLDRLALLAVLRTGSSDDALAGAIEAIAGAVVQTSSGVRLLVRSGDLLVQNLVDTAADVGRKYLDGEKSSWRAAFVAGAGGGALMALATILKFSISALHLPALYEGLAFSFNYASAFVAAYLLHFTIATKLPAHTAAALARSVQNGTESHRRRLRAFVGVWRSTLRLQLAGLVGNVVVAGPLAYALDVGAVRAFGHHLITAEKAHHVLAESSILGPSILFAALTGLFLWLSSLVGAWGDNWARVRDLGDRLATNRHVMNRIGAARARSYADAIVARVGGLLGNVTLGFLLGGVPMAFAIARIPVEIRHVTVSTGSVAVAIATHTGTRADLALAISGVAAIAIVNVGVSFVLALALALRATRGLRASPSSHALVRIGIRRAFR